jgi:hypothetical protein
MQKRRMSGKSNLRAMIVLMMLSLLIMIPSCSDKEKQTSTKPPENAQQRDTPSSAGQKEITSEKDLNYGEGRKIYRIDKEDLNNDRRDELIVLSISSNNAEEQNSMSKFDMIEVFVLDSVRGKYVKNLTDTVDFAVDAKYVDLGASGIKEIVVFTNSGGNNSLASEGMFIFGMDKDNSVRLIRYFDSGAPQITQAGKGGSQQILITDLFHGVMPMAYAVPYTGSIYEFEHNDLVLSNDKYPEYYDKKIEVLVEKYKGLKRKVEMGMQPVNLSYPLYREAAEVIVNYKAKGDMKGLRRFWEEERESLKKNIPADEFSDLSNYVKKVLPPDNNA